jgi:hypothetical protein
MWWHWRKKKYSEISLNSQSVVERELFAGGVSCTLFAVFVYFKSVSLFYLKRVNMMMEMGRTCGAYGGGKRGAQGVGGET